MFRPNFKVKVELVVRMLLKGQLEVKKANLPMKEQPQYRHKKVRLKQTCNFHSGEFFSDFFPLLDENNWNPIEWERAAEELTWERVSLITIYCFIP